jgi:hypothetical protein
MDGFAELSGHIDMGSMYQDEEAGEQLKGYN